MTEEAAVQTHAHDAEPDMFTAEAAPAAPAPNDPSVLVQITGRLIKHAEVRTMVVGQDHHPVPVLCMDLRPLTGLKRTIHAEQIYTEATRVMAEMKARGLTKGSHITITTALDGMRVILPHVRSVVHLEPEASS